MASRKWEEVEQQVEVSAPPEEPEAAIVASEGESGASAMTAALLDGWDRVTGDDGTEQYINRRTFLIPGGTVEQGVLRPLAEAYALEVQRCG